MNTSTENGSEKKSDNQMNYYEDIFNQSVIEAICNYEPIDDRNNSLTSDKKTNELDILSSRKSDEISSINENIGENKPRTIIQETLNQTVSNVNDVISNTVENVSFQDLKQEDQLNCKTKLESDSVILEKTKLKKKKNLLLLISLPLFVVIEFVIYVLIIFFPKLVMLDETSFSSVALAFVYSIIICKNWKKDCFIVLAMFFTMLSDMLLEIFNGSSEPTKQLASVCTFSIAQIMYAVRMMLFKSGKFIAINVSLRAIVVITIEVIAIHFIVVENFDALVGVSIFYYTNLVFNVIYGFIDIRYNIIMPIGFLLFALCDLIIGLSVGAPYLNYTEDSFFYKITHTKINLAWFFYLPSQAILSCSSLAFVDRGMCDKKFKL